MSESGNKLKFPNSFWAVFNGHVNNASQRAMAICEQVFDPNDEQLIDLQKKRETGIMAIFDESPNPVTQFYGSLCMVFANGLDKEHWSALNVARAALDMPPYPEPEHWKS